MRYRRLGKTGLKVSVIGLGTWQFGGEWGRRFTQAEVDRIVRRARELGINLVDTAECYGDHLPEGLIGRAIAHEREQWVVATKFGHRFHADRMQRERWSPVDLRTDHWSPAEVVEQLDASQRALGTDYIDVYRPMAHPTRPPIRKGLWAALHEQVQRARSATSASRLGPTRTCAITLALAARA